MANDALNTLLTLISERIDGAHLRRVEERYRRSFAYESVDFPPLVILPKFPSTIALPAPWDGFPTHTYREAFDDPATMLSNMLLGRVVPGVLLKDDSPLAIRNDHGTVQVASALGCRWRMHEDNYPAADHLASVTEIERIVEAPRTCPLSDAGVVPRSLAALRFYRGKLHEFPLCETAIQISMPDLQGPFDTAEMLWGSDIYYALYDAPALLERLLERVTDTMLEMVELYRPYSAERLPPAGATQHGYAVPGSLLVRNDSSILITPDMYARFVRRHDARVLDAVHGGSIHFCGNGRHLVEPMLEIATLRGLDFGDAPLMDIDAIYHACAERRIVLTNLTPSREDLVSGAAARRFPTGVVFVYQTERLDDAMEVLREYHRASRVSAA